MLAACAPGAGAGNPGGCLTAVRGAPHEALLPRCAAVMHHGGAGTTAAALRAGTPQLVCPLHFDQFTWVR